MFSSKLRDHHFSFQKMFHSLMILRMRPLTFESILERIFQLGPFILQKLKLI